MLKELVRKSIGETKVSHLQTCSYLVQQGSICDRSKTENICCFTWKSIYIIVCLQQELRRFPTLQAEIAAASNEALERFREDGRKTVVRLVDMESSYLTVEFFRRLPQEVEKGGNPAAAASNPDRYSEGHFRRIGSNVSSYVGMVSETLKNTIPKAVVYCQVREAKQSLLNHFYTQLGKKEVLSRSHTCAHILGCTVDFFFFFPAQGYLTLGLTRVTGQFFWQKSSAH